MKSIPSFSELPDADLAAEAERLTEIARQQGAKLIALLDECERRGLDPPEGIDIERIRSEYRK